MNLLKAIMYKNIDEARQVLRDCRPGADLAAILDDGEEEPQGLLTVVPEDLLSEEEFVSLFDLRNGVLVEVERISYSGFGPPAEEHNYMGFVTRKSAYVLKGTRFSVEIDNCPLGAGDFHELDAMILDGSHPCDPDYLAHKLDLPEGWDFDTLFDWIVQGRISAEEIDRLIHQCIH